VRNKLKVSLRGTDPNNIPPKAANAGKNFSLSGVESVDETDR